MLKTESEWERHHHQMGLTAGVEEKEEEEGGGKMGKKRRNQLGKESLMYKATKFCHLGDLLHLLIYVTPLRRRENG